MKREFFAATLFALLFTLIGHWGGYNAAILRVSQIGLLPACEEQRLPILACDSLPEPPQ